jgi:hypothetical protein
LFHVFTDSRFSPASADDAQYREGEGSQTIGADILCTVVADAIFAALNALQSGLDLRDFVERGALQPF